MSLDEMLIVYQIRMLVTIINPLNHLMKLMMKSMRMEKMEEMKMIMILLNCLWLIRDDDEEGEELDLLLQECFQNQCLK